MLHIQYKYDLDVLVREGMQVNGMGNLVEWWLGKVTNQET